MTPNNFERTEGRGSRLAWQGLLSEDINGLTRAASSATLWKMRNQRTNTTIVGLRLISFTTIRAPYTLATWCKELTHLKRPWCWERLRTGGEGDDRGWDGQMASSTPCTWVWVDSGSWWWAGRPGTLRFMGSQRVRHDWATELNWCTMACQVVLVIKNPPANAGDVKDTGLMPGSERSPRGGHGNPLQYSCLENPMDKGAWWATVHRVTNNRTWPKWLSKHACTKWIVMYSFQLHYFLYFIFVSLFFTF